MVKRLGRFLSYVLVAMLASVLTLYFLGTGGGPGSNKLMELENLIADKFIGDYDKTAMEDAAAYAMIHSINDEWSYYIPAAELAFYREQTANAYIGIGVTIEQKEDGMLVTKANPDGPAYEAGIREGDCITKVNGIIVAGDTATEAKNQIRGEEGTYVEITVDRGGTELVFDVERREILVEVATCQMLPDGIGLIRIENFDSRCAEMTIECIKSLLKQGATALIFDVRNNPGGYKSEMVKVLDYLLPEGPLFRSIDYRGVESVDKSDAEHLDIPIAVIVNGESYSAAEFFAAALREYDAAFVVGTKTYGKGYFQYTYKLSDGSAVALSAGKYFTPKGISLAGNGIIPDYEVPVDEETAYAIYAGKMPALEDPQILAAIRGMKERNTP